LLLLAFAALTVSITACSDGIDGVDALADGFADGFEGDLAGHDLAGHDLSNYDIDDRDNGENDLAGTDTNTPDTDNPDGYTPDVDNPDGYTPDVDNPDGYTPDALTDGVEPGDNGGDTVEPARGCTFTDGTNYLLIQADVFAPDSIIRDGHVLIDPTGFIACVAQDCSASTGFAGATTISCPSALVTPGLINGHDHVTYDGNTPKAHTVKYDHRHEWRTGKVTGKPKISVPQTSGAEEWSELRHVVGGATAMFGSGYGTGLLRNLDQELIDIPAGYKAKYDTFPLDDTNGIMLTSGCSYPGITAWTSVSGFRAYVPHISEGINAAANNEFQCLSSTDGGGQDLVRENSGIIHGIGLKAADIATMAVDGTGLIWSARTNIDLYGNTAAIPLYDLLGVQIGLGPDWTASGSMNMMRELNCVDYLNRNHFNNHFTDRQVVELATIGNARVFNIDDKIGQLKVGLVADIAIFSTTEHPDERALIEGNPGDVLITMRSGIPLYGDTNLVDGLLPGDAGCEPLSVCGVPKKVCAKRETGVALATMQAGGGYDLFFCGVPTGEPSCEPSRPGEYDGVTADDDDGDGVSDAQDNCPLIFNPIRPMDNGVQADNDGDDVGDVCDPCPFDANTTECTGFNPDDVDGDTVVNEFDNCPRHPNLDQTDTDDDNIGDVCDECPQDANPDGAACPATIYDVKDGTVEVGRMVALSDVIVTGVAKSGTSLTGFFVQVDESASYYAGPEYSGVYVYAKGFSPIPAVGDVVSFSGKVTLFWGQIEMTDISGFVKNGTAATPAPTLVSPADVATGGVDAQAMEAVLVEIQNVSVTSVNPPVGGGDSSPNNEFVVDGSLRVNDFMYLISPFPVVGDGFDSIVGVMRLGNDDFKLEPRGAADVMATTPELAISALTPAHAWYPWGSGFASATPIVTAVMNRAVQEGETAELTITSSAPTDLFPLTTTVTVPVGANTVEIQFDSGVPGSGTQDVDICAGFASEQACNVVTLVTQEYMPSIAAIEPSGTVNAVVGVPKTFEVTFDVPVFADEIQVTFEVDDPTIVPVPAAVDLPWGALSATFSVTPATEGTADLTVNFLGSSEVITLNVTDVPQVADVRIVEMFYDHTTPTVDSGYEWVKLYNAGAVAQDLTGWSLANGGTSWATAKWNISGVIAPGECMVIGGPLADAENGNPTYDLVLDFEPDIQNSGSASEAADGVGLFDMPAASVTASSVPVDAVIYGGVNLNNLIGPDGNVAAVDIAKATPGDSLARGSDGTWEFRANPTPMLCPPWEYLP